MDIIILNASTALGLRTIGAYRTATELRNHGYTVKVIEFSDYITLDGIDLLKKILIKFMTSSTLWIGVSSTWMWKVRDIHQGKEKANRADIPNIRSNSLDINSAEYNELKTLIKTISPNCKIVCGGARATQLPATDFYDVYMYGYSEIHAVDFTKWLQGKNPFFQYNNESGKMVIDYNVKADGFDFVNSTTDWTNENIFPGEALPIEIARGCIFKCKFCSFMLNGKKQMDYIRDPGKIYEEIIKNYEMFGVKDYALSDDTYNDSTEKLELLYNKVWSRLPFKASFSCYLRLDLLHAHKEQVQILKESGLLATFFGIESLNNETNKAIGKGMTERRIIETLEYCANVWGKDIATSSGFIVGLPNDTEQTCRRWLEKIFEKSFPLDTKIVYPLFIGQKSNKIWTSEFEKNPEQYGYELELSDNHGAAPKWYNKKTGMTSEIAQKIAEEYYPKMLNQRPAGFVNTALKGFDQTNESLTTYMQTSENQKIIRDIFSERRRNYWQKLLNE